MFLRILILVASLFVTTTSAVAGERLSADLVRTIDGDTAVFLINGEEVRVRFLGIDAPEMGFTRQNGRIVVDPNKKEPGAREATEKVDRLLQNANTITLQTDPARAGFDRFGRLRAWIWADDILVQEALVAAGLAEPAFLNPNMIHARRIWAARP